MRISRKEKVGLNERNGKSFCSKERDLEPKESMTFFSREQSVFHHKKPQDL